MTTEKKAPSSASVQSSAQLRYEKSLLDSMIGVFRAEPDWNVTWASEGLLEFTGLTLEQARNTGWLQTVHEQERQRVARAMARAAGGGDASIVAEYSMLRYDGESIRVHVNNVPEKNSKGEVIGYLGVVLDMAERQRLNEELKELETRFRTLARIAPVGIYRCDVDGVLLFCNARWFELSGVEQPLLPGQKNLDAIHPDDREQLLSLGRMFLRSDRQAFPSPGSKESPRFLEIEYRFLHEDGRVVWVLDRCIPERSADGHIRGFLGTLTDVTQMKAVTEEITALHSQLEKKVQERTAELEAANAEMEAFCYSVSHDLRGPLRSIDGFSQLVLEDPDSTLSPESVEHMATVRESSEHMGRLIDDLLSLSRLSRRELNHEVVDLSEVCELIVSALQQSSAATRHQVRIAAGMTAFGDPALLQSLLENLIGNAWKFSADCASPNIEVGFDGSGETAVYFVKDNGVGFDMAYKTKLFKPFERLHNNRRYPGAGVGLASAQRIVSRHGGRIWAESRPGQGATFFFTLGRKQESAR